MQASRNGNSRAGCCIIELLRLLWDEEGEKHRFQRMEDEGGGKDGEEMKSPLFDEGNGGERTPPMPGTYVRERAAHSCVISFSDAMDCELVTPLTEHSIDFVPLVHVPPDVDFVLLKKTGARQTLANFAGRSAAGVTETIATHAAGNSFRVRFQDETYAAVFVHGDDADADNIEIVVHVCSYLSARRTREPPAKEEKGDGLACKAKAVLFCFRHIRPDTDPANQTLFAMVLTESPDDSCLLYKNPILTDARSTRRETQ